MSISKAIRGEDFPREQDICRELEQRHRDAMLDLVLAWGELDGALGMLLSAASSIPMADGAQKFGRLPGSEKLQQLFKAVRAHPNGTNAAKQIRKHKKAYELHSFPRNRIAHSKCLGINRLDRDFILFAAFEKYGDDELIIDAIPIQVMERATRWGKAMTGVALKIVDRIAPLPTQC